MSHATSPVTPSAEALAAVIRGQLATIAACLMLSCVLQFAALAVLVFR